VEATRKRTVSAVILRWVAFLALWLILVGGRNPADRPAIIIALVAATWPAYLPIPPHALSNPLTFEALSSGLWPILAGGVIAILIGRGAVRTSGIPRLVGALVERARCAVLVPTDGVMRIDWALRRWPAAVLGLLVLAALFGIALLAGGDAVG
jgi:hypothetical protein